LRDRGLISLNDLRDRGGHTQRQLDYKKATLSDISDCGVRPSHGAPYLKGRKRPPPLPPTELAAAHPALADAARLAAPWLQRAAVAALGAALAAEAALVALVPANRADAWQLPMLLALLWQAYLNLAAHSAAADADEAVAREKSD